ncbi:hypothetical protein BN1723_012484 [Verticillium longisporum]|uniref:MFS transporter n=1 Tax=Verticillium longisporum TaxID=100787 RepID=A0A0G4LIT5_VERLO|nr:hypothetical protein VdG1_03466 [Verticillium dahliae VDG1]KAG7104604.1 hypothetical protein HYQ44_015916 [Verticillium longisporum]RBQ98125.1 hypothetical protein VDGD_20131 [Verticillium dahliae]CRK13924.1 hypothetical protein BN1708_010977 [Verticillium longisporum]CRK21814.1 hypothetical protein BN1723_012484 [Verticillium longisporum]
MHRLSLLLLLLSALVAIASASSAPTFCKCTCFKNSTIVALGPQHGDQSPPSSLRRDLFSSILPFGNVRRRHTAAAEDRQLAPRSASTSCSQCTKAFCLSRGIDFCREAKEDDVQTMCFQRDSNKDRVIVWGFILGTLGLLGWAGVRKAAESRGVNGYGFLGRGRA